MSSEALAYYSRRLADEHARAAEAPTPEIAVGQDAIVYDITRPVRPARPHAASPAELARHAAFLAKITDPMWLDGTAAAAAG